MADYRITVTSPSGREDYTTHRTTPSAALEVVQAEMDPTMRPEPGTKITVEVLD